MIVHNLESMAMACIGIEEEHQTAQPAHNCTVEQAGVVCH